MYTYPYSNYNPKANPNSVIEGNNYRITILTSKLFRIEYSKQNKFEDSQTMTVLNRYFKTPNFKKYETQDLITIVTEDLILKYDKQEFSPYGLSVELNGEINAMYKSNWHFGDWPENLKSTISTLDGINGSTELENGILSKTGIAILDDSGSPIFGEDGWHQERNSNDYDLYIFGFKRDYLGALDTFYKLSGKQPKIPRYALGNWWSRFYRYSEESYLNLVDRFEKEKIPFSTYVIDMDWHLTDIDPKYGSGWTGFTWNKDLFPNPKRFIKALKEKGKSVTLNLHPADGVRAFEDGYLEMAKELDVDYKNEEIIDFNPNSKKLMESMFKHLYYPNEKIGIDFWWLDWQQSPHRKNKNKDPLWILNHSHYQDNQKNDNLGITFSRYFGPGSHRYPIGFSGDSVISWESLDFQPYFTSTASNIGFGWWSHDIGGHMWGEKDDELMLRWVQFGVFSPINRLHSSNSPFLGKEPWNFREPYASLIKKFLQIRHELVPYLYHMNVLSSEQNITLIRPMYYKYPYFEESYEVKNQYFLGENLIVVPFTKKSNPKTLLSEATVWLPKGEWLDVFTGIKYAGERTIKIFRPIDKMAVFIDYGDIIPMANIEDDKYTSSIENPKSFNLYMNGIGDKSFTLIEDFVGKEKTENQVKTKFESCSLNYTITIHSAEGNLNAIPSIRDWNIKIFGLKITSATIDEKSVECIFDDKTFSTYIKLGEHSVKKDLVVKIEDFSLPDLKTENDRRIFELLDNAQISNTDKDYIYNICKNSKNINTMITKLLSVEFSMDIINAILEIYLSYIDV